MTSLVEISCACCGAKTRTTYRWMTGERRIVCMNCFHEVDLDGPELARTLAKIDDAVKVIDDAAAELRMPLRLDRNSPDNAPPRG
jgi:hypothetical protein